MAYQGANANLCGKMGQACAKTVVQAMAKGEVAIGLTANIKGVWLRKLFGIAIACTQYKVNSLPPHSICK